MVLWSIIGIISKDPIINETGYIEEFRNEDGVDGRYNYLKNIVGLWILQQYKKRWVEEGQNVTWDEIIRLTIDAGNNNIYIDVDNPIFEKEIFDMTYMIRNYCKKTNQKEPQTIGEVARCIYESLVLKYALNLKKLEKITKKKIELLHLVGGGSKNKLLCQWVSNATCIPVIAGPAETTAVGNILLQMLASGDICSIKEGREIVTKSTELGYFEPIDVSNWNYKFRMYTNVLFN